jgi:hypothetical protein
MNKRVLPRLRRRLKLFISERLAFTSDLSAGGFAVELMTTLLPGSMVHGLVCVGEKELPFTGTVTWAMRAEPRLQIRGRAGIRVTGIDPEYFDVFTAR